MQCSAEKGIARVAQRSGMGCLLNIECRASQHNLARRCPGTQAMYLPGTKVSHPSTHGNPKREARNGSRAVVKVAVYGVVDGRVIEVDFTPSVHVF
jgi:hypothetical protein